MVLDALGHPRCARAAPLFVWTRGPHAVSEAAEVRKNPPGDRNPQEMPLTQFFSPGIYPALFYRFSETQVQRACRRWRSVGGESAVAVRP